MTGSAIAIPLLAAASASAADTSTWDKVAACESGGVWNANLGNSYFGGLQLSQNTWDEFGGSQYASRPDLATKAQQIAVAEKILASQGSGTWASCAESSGLPASTPSPDASTGSDGGLLGGALGGLLGGSGDSSGSDGSATSSTPDDTATTSPSDTASGSASSNPAGDAASSGASGLAGVLGTPSPGATAGPGGDGTTGGAHASQSTGKHRAASSAPSGDSSATDDDGFPLGVSRDNGGGITPSTATGGAGSIGNADQPGVVRDAGGSQTPTIRIPFAPHYGQGGSGHARSGSLFATGHFGPSSVWADPNAVRHSAPGAGAAASGHATASSAPSASPTAAGGPGGVAGRPGPSGSATAGGKHRGGSAPEATASTATASGPSTGASGSSTASKTAESDGSGQSGRHAGSGDASSTASGTSTAPDDSYTVRAGDSLSGIAASRRVDGGWRALYEANKSVLGSDPDHILPGQTLDLGVG
ncbi:transglycosylase family protein [Streptomyces sp. NRRL F-5126]|uniref:transglycosylase family protein n=1 Tax=Streptomyces sp. NRRL F-5126 TaxID=1463857 RepID=UPI00068F01E7|nr:transglycosylase family protein [Streptomyces sp. NRRL F-5126]